MEDTTTQEKTDARLSLEMIREASRGVSMSTTIADAVHMAGEEEVVTVKVSKAEICGHFLAAMIMSDFEIASKTAADMAHDLLMMCGEITAANALKSHVAFCSNP